MITFPQIHTPKMLLSQVKNFIEIKDVESTYSCLLGFRLSGEDQSQWAKYLVRIFSFLTDEEITLPSFFRRKPIMSIFKIVLDYKLSEIEDGEFPSKFKNQVIILLQFFLDIFKLNTLRKDIFLNFDVFWNYIDRFFSALTGNSPFSNPEAKITADDTRILEGVFPNPSGKGPEITNTQLALWYEFFLNLKNYMTLKIENETKTILFIANLRKEAELVTEPVLRWLNIYNFVEETINIQSYHGGNLEIENVCIKETSFMFKYIQESFDKYLVKTSFMVSQEDNENVFRTMVRFNIVKLSFCLIQNSVSEEKTLLIALIEETKKILTLIINRSLEENAKWEIQENEMDNENMRDYFEKLARFRTELKFIYQQLNRRINFIEAKSRATRFNVEEEEPKNRPDKQYLYFDLWVNKDCKYLVQNNAFPYPKTNEVCKTIMFFLQNGQKSEPKDPNKPLIEEFFKGLEMASMCYLLEHLFESKSREIKSIIRNNLPLPNAILLCLRLITERFFNHKELFLLSIELSMEYLNEFAHSPTAFKDQHKVFFIEKCKMLLKLCENSNSNYHPTLYSCSSCQRIENNTFCNRCGLPCFIIVYPNNLPLNWGEQFFICQDSLTHIFYRYSNQI